MNNYSAYIQIIDKEPKQYGKTVINMEKFFILNGETYCITKLAIYKVISLPTITSKEYLESLTFNDNIKIIELSPMKENDSLFTTPFVYLEVSLPYLKPKQTIQKEETSTPKSKPKETPKEKEKEKEEKYDEIQKASHYNQTKFECIDEMIIMFGIQATIQWCIITAYKYKHRCGQKPNEPNEKDLSKADWYLTKAKELQDSQQQSQ